MSNDYYGPADHESKLLAIILDQEAEIDRLKDVVDVVVRAQRLLSVCEFDDENDLADLVIVLGNL